MAISDQLQTLISAFIFGSLFQTAIAAVLLFLRGCGLKVIQDRRRLALVIFLSTAATWAQIDFINYAVPPTSESVCQGTVVVSALLDQAGRAIMGGFLLWSVGHVRKSKSEAYGLGALVGSRVILGIVFVAYTRPQFAPVCVAQSNMLSVSAIVIALDVIVIGILAIRIFTLGLIATIRDIRSTTRQEQSKALVYCTAGFFLWTITSAAMLLGAESTILLLRTAFPAVGLMVLITVMTLQCGALVLPHEQDSVVPEARSPFLAIRSRSMESANDGNGSPISSTGYRKTGKLFVVNTCSMLNSARNTIFQRDSKADSRGSATSASASKSNIGIENRAGDSSRIYDGVPMATGAIISAGTAKGVINQTPDLYPKKMTIAERRQKRAILGRAKGAGVEGAPKLTISGPIMEDTQPRPLSRVRTVELGAAASSERARREELAARRLVATRAAPPPPVISNSEALRKLSVTKRKDVPRMTSLSKRSVVDSTKLPSGSGLLLDVNATSSSASLSPAIRDVRRRSPRTFKDLERDLGPQVKKLPEIPKNQSPRSQSTQRTVIHMEDIQYNKPSLVKSVIKGTTRDSIKQDLRGEEYCDVSPISPRAIPSTSIMHRPRPQRRNSEQYRTFLGSQPSPDRKPSNALSFTKPKNLPDSQPLRTPKKPPTSAAELKRLLPNETLSMTTCERISLLFPAPPGAFNNGRRSSVPSLPRIPSIVFGSDSLEDVLTEQELQTRRSLRRSTISFGTSPISDIGISIAQKSVKSYHMFESTSDGLLRDTIGDHGSHTAAAKEASISSSKEKSAFSVSDFDDEEYQDAMKSAYASLHSPILAVDITTAMQTAKETFIQMRKEPNVNGKSSQSDSSSLPSKEHAKESFMTVMPNIGAAETTEISARRTILADTRPSNANQQKIGPQFSGTWHRRIGEELPAFSGRRKHSTSQSTPPPPPLQLNSKGRRATVVSREPVIDDVIDTPGKAMRAIQAQMSKFDGPGRGSPGFLSRYVPHVSPGSISTSNDDPLGLLANLEEEMGRQETHWMQMQQTFNRDSNSVIMTPYAELKALPSPPSEESSQRSSPSSDRRLRTRSAISKKSRGDNSIATPSTQTSENSGVSAWQRRLAEAQSEYAETKLGLAERQFVNFLSFSKMNIGTPTPPDSVDSGNDSGSDMEYIGEAQSKTSHKGTKSSVKTPSVELLWKPKQSPLAIMAGYLWSQPLRNRRALSVPFEPAALASTQLRRRDQQPSIITSSELWSKRVDGKSKSGVSGLWGSDKARPSCVVSVATRPKTQRPERKSRRVTFLPDIIEDPSPLPHKRDTLGIFRFPWGEKSASAVYEQIPLPQHANFHNFTFNHYLETKPLPVPPELEEIEDYSSTFFGEYGEFYGDGSDSTSDDDFDEATLWEIANLLHSQDVPSKNSLLPPPQIIEDYDDDDLGEEATESIQVYNQVMETPPQSPIVTDQSLAIQTPPSAHLWLKPNKSSVSKLDICIGQPEEHAWQAYISPIQKPVRAKPRNDLSQASISNLTSRNLWDNQRSLKSRSNGNISLWSQQVVMEEDEVSSSPYIEK